MKYIYVFYPVGGSKSFASYECATSNSKTKVLKKLSVVKDNFRNAPPFYKNFHEGNYDLRLFAFDENNQRTLVKEWLNLPG